MPLLGNMSLCVFNHMCDQHQCLNIGHVSGRMLAHKNVKGVVIHTSVLTGKIHWAWWAWSHDRKLENEKERAWVKRWGFEHVVLSAFLRIYLPTAKARKLLGPPASSLTSQSLTIVTFCLNTAKETSCSNECFKDSSLGPTGF